MGRGRTSSLVGLLHPDRLAVLFAGLTEAKALVLAVSGGPDSMALLRLASTWIAGRSTPAVYVATVDHGLRPGAAEEAADVRSVANELGFPHATLIWEAPKPRTRIQERARAARYALLADHARAVKATHVLTAHHADDQAETILMRLGRGSGLDGLSGMRRETTLAPGLLLVRPLLEIPKNELIGICRDAGQAFVDDPSNSDEAFARVRLRSQAGAAARLGLDRATLIRLAARARRAEAALDAEAHRLETQLAPTRRPEIWAAHLIGAPGAEPDVLLRLLRRAILHVGGPRKIRLDRLETLAERLGAALAEKRALRATLGGAVVLVTPQAFATIKPEPLRRRGRFGQSGDAGVRAPTDVEVTR